MRTSWRHTRRSDLLPSSDSVPHHTPPAINPLLQTLETLLSGLSLVNLGQGWMPSPDACSRTLPSTGANVATPPTTLMSPYTHSIDFSPPQQSAGRVRPHLRPFTQPFSSRLLLTRPTLPRPAAALRHTTSTLFQEKAHTPSSNTIALSRLYPAVPAVFSAKLSAAWKARESCSCSNSHVHQSILFHSSSLFVFIIEGSAWNWIVLGFHGRRLWLVQKERLFVAFNWRQPSFLLLFTANWHQKC